LGYQWINPHINYDNIFNGILSLFIASTQENWPNMMFSMADANDAIYGPEVNSNRYFAYGYFIVFVFVGSFFLINLFIGAIFLEFTRAEKRQNKLHKFLTVTQQRWVVMQRLIVLIRADVSFVEPEIDWMKRFFRIISHRYFDRFSMLMIFLNIIALALAYDEAPSTYNYVLKYVKWVFSLIFIIEMTLKHLGWGFKRYWRSGWNQFDAFVVFASIFDFLLDVFQSSFSSIVSVGPQLVRIFRVLRITKLAKLVKKFQGLQKILKTLIFSLPSLFNVGALLFLVYFIYAILGTFLFNNIQRGTLINDEVHFRNAAVAFITLFRSSTGESWYQIMFDTLYPEECIAKANSCGTCINFPLLVY